VNGDRQVLVVGGAGYVGSALTRHLLRTTGARVRVLDSLIYGHGMSLAGFSDDERFSFVRGDVRSDVDVALAMEGVTDVVLLAALVGDPVCKRNPEVAPAVNVEGAMRVASAAAEGTPKRFVFASTCSNYGLRDETDPPAVETDELKPLSIYAENKVEVESRLLGDPLDGMDATVMRVSTAYGMSQRMRFDLTVSEFTRELTLGNELDVYDADTWRPYAHVDDIAEGIRTALEAPAEAVAGEVFNLGGDDGNYTKRMIVEAALEALDGEGTVRWVEGGVDARNYRVSFDKIKDVLGFEATRTVPGAIANLAAAIRSGVFDAVTDANLQSTDLYSNANYAAPTQGEGSGGGDAG